MKQDLTLRNRRQQGMRKRPQSAPAHLVAPRNISLGYLNMPKAACTTIKNILFFLEQGFWYPDPLGIHKLIAGGHALARGAEIVPLKNQGKPWLNFTFVRDPAKRAFSAFTEKIWNSGKYSFPRIRQHLNEKYMLKLPPMQGVDQINNDVLNRQIAEAFEIFLYFVRDNLARKTPFPPNPHWAVQHLRVVQMPIADTIHFIGRVENFEHDMKYVVSHAGITDLTVCSRRFNEGPKPPVTLEEILTPESKELVKELYKNDYEAFGYAL